MLLGTLGATLLGNMLAGKGVMRTGEGTIRAGEGAIRAGQYFYLLLRHPLTNFEIEKYYQNEPNFNGVNSRNNLPKIKVGAYVINLDECKSIGTRRIAHNSFVCEC